ncbi:PREDICTED: uncharacterized protein LOC108560651 [Nicrophorus vespilloides]|uniref:Uncharacterized protein LOC108560651 n=1 Tax=Nicrophorus vespilloides TaxID=110193 RepID=A0ABM1MGT2_NICVS|nr:PREDICTED: uncharacterized protein LOC108560651 [Nicrophorus vespilloides]
MGSYCTEITPKKVIKYLWVSIDSILSYAENIRAVAIRAAETTTAVSRLMHNKGVPKSSKRRLLGVVAQSIMLYAAPIWEQAMIVLSYRKVLETVQRRGEIRICSAYRTISRDAVQVIAGVPPIELLVLERDERQRGATKVDAQARLLQKWQDKWHRSEKLAWTRRLIPWLSRKHGETTFHLSQALSGHVCFGKYLHIIAKKKKERCWYCEKDDTPEHTLFRCCRWVRRKHEAEAELGVLLEPENVISEILQSAESWDIVAYISEMLLSKEED